jgi:hypothetical protein
MWPWSKSDPPRLGDIEERLEKVERKQKSLETDWLEFEEKVQRKVWRVAKMSQKNQDGEGQPDPPPSEEGGRSDAPDPTIDGRDPVSRRIILQRRQRFVPGGG